MEIKPTNSQTYWNKMKKIILMLCVLFGLSMQAANVEELWCQKGDKRIYGKLFRPDQPKEKMPLIIISHGFGSSYHAGVPYAEAFTKQGYMV